jgi:Ca2+-transporting ATPase
MSVLARKSGSDKNVLFLKGAPEKLIESAQNIQLQGGVKEALTAQDRKDLIAKIDSFCNMGLRVVGIAIKEDTGDFATFNGISDKNHPKFDFLKKVENYAQVEQGSTLLGFVGISDPVRKEVPKSIDLCRQAGINVFMITGDNKNTAVAVAKQCGLINDANAQHNTIDGSELQQLLEKDPEGLKKRLRKVLDNSEGMVFARTTPTQKRDLVKILKEVNQVVAMTGDGTNDAAALKQADIGIAMGIAGTEVAKDNCDMILVDDNFATIVKAIEEGRGIYENMKVSLDL